MTTTNSINKILQNHRNHVTIVGLYGAKDNKLMEPSNPDCDLVVIVRSTIGKIVYFIERDEFRRVLAHNELCKLSETNNINAHKDIIRNKVREYINSNDIEINKEEIHGFKKMALPLIRHTSPSMVANSLVSVQPMTTPSGLVDALKNNNK